MSDLRSNTRRQLLGSAGAMGALAFLPANLRAAESGANVSGNVSGNVTGHITERLARYMVSAQGQILPEAVLTACKHRILDTLGAMVSGARMKPGLMAVGYVRGLGGTPQSGVVASSFRTHAANAALANAMCAHADETDDFEPVTKAHPGCSSVPAALAMADKNGASGEDFIRAVALGYDLGCRLLVTLGADEVRLSHRSAEGTSSTFCALGAAAPLARLDELQTRYAISYAAQQVAGLWNWVNDEDHVEKSFDFAGMGARNGVMAVTMAEAGLTGVHDALDSTHNLFLALSKNPRPEAMLEGLGSRFYVTETAIKTYSVGYPNQSALDAMLFLRKQYGLKPADVQNIVVKLPSDAIGIVGDSAMADVNCQHLVSLALLKGAVSFNDSHDAALMNDPAVLAIRRKVQLTGDQTLMDPTAPRGAIVEVTTTDGRHLEHHTRFPPGTKENPLSTEAVNAKVRDLMAPVLGSAKTEQLIVQVNALEKLDDVRRLRPLLTA